MMNYQIILEEIKLALAGGGMFSYSFKVEEIDLGGTKILKLSQKSR